MWGTISQIITKIRKERGMFYLVEHAMKETMVSVVRTLSKA